MVDLHRIKPQLQSPILPNSDSIPDRRLIPVEVKATPRPSSRDLAGLNAFLDTYGAASFGVITCPCPAPKVLSSRIIALPLNLLLLS